MPGELDVKEWQLKHVWSHLYLKKEYRGTVFFTCHSTLELAHRKLQMEDAFPSSQNTFIITSLNVHIFVFWKTMFWKEKEKKKKKEKWFLSMKLQEVLGCGCRGKYYPSHLLIQKNTALSLIKTIRDCYHLDQAQNTWQHVILDNILALTADRKEGIVIDSQIPMTGYLFLHSIHWKFVYFLLIRYNLEEICFLFPLENLLSHLLPLDIFFFFEYFLFSKLTCCLGM